MYTHTHTLHIYVKLKILELAYTCCANSQETNPIHSSRVLIFNLREIIRVVELKMSSLSCSELETQLREAGVKLLALASCVTTQVQQLLHILDVSILTPFHREEERERDRGGERDRDR